MAEELKRRSEVSEDLKWDLKGIFSSEEEFDEVLEEFLDSVKTFVGNYKGNLTDSETVVDALANYEEIIEKQVI